MATPDRDTIYTNDGTNRTVYTRESNATGWFVGIIVALALLAIAYLVFSANSQPSTTTVNAPAATTTAPADTNTTPMAPADNTTTTTPAPADNGAATTTVPAENAPATTSSTPAAQ